jgi:hypothetical protein
VAEIITREQLDHLLSDWCAGRMTSAAVHDWAVERYAVSDFTPEDVIVNEVLARLDMLDANLTTADDVPALRRLLASRPPSLAEAVSRYEEYLESVDCGERRRRLTKEPMYAPFCS